MATHTPWALTLIVAAALSGCLGDGVLGPPLGPLEVRVLNHQVHDLYNVSVTLSFVNTGTAPLTKIESHVNARAYREGYTGSQPDGRVVNYPGKYFRSSAIFNHTDVLAPGSPWNVTLRVTYEPSGAFYEIQEGDVYVISVDARFQDTETRWHWKYDLPCFDEDGHDVKPDAVVCDRYVGFVHLPAEPLDRE